VAIRVVLAKPGLDGHDRGVKVIAMALRDAGAEVVYLGLRQSVDAILRAAADEDADVVGLSILSGAHLALAGALLDRRAHHGLDDLPVVIGGTIPPADVEVLLERGAAGVFPVGAALGDVVDAILEVGSGHRYEGVGS
jgi:methylmalonyl-CoA mutase C-terminal domain/subunit